MPPLCPQSQLPLQVLDLVVAGGVAFAFWVPSVVKALEIWFMIAPMMGLVFWIGLFWRRMTVAGAWVGVDWVVWAMAAVPTLSAARAPASRAASLTFFFVFKLCLLSRV